MIDKQYRWQHGQVQWHTLILRNHEQNKVKRKYLKKYIKYGFTHKDKQDLKQLHFFFFLQWITESNI